MKTKLEMLYANLEGKTDYAEIEEILRATPIATLKEYIKEECIPCEGWSYWKKADFVETVSADIRSEIRRTQEEIVMTKLEQARTAGSMDKAHEVLATSDVTELEMIAEQVSEEYRAEYEEAEKTLGGNRELIRLWTMAWVLEKLGYEFKEWDLDEYDPDDEPEVSYEEQKKAEYANLQKQINGAKRKQTALSAGMRYLPLSSRENETLMEMYETEEYVILALVNVRRILKRELEEMSKKTKTV